jgi:hypothetical protein
LEAVKRWLRRNEERTSNLAWSVIGGLVGGGIGLLFAMLWLRGR